MALQAIFNKRVYFNCLKNYFNNVNVSVNIGILSDFDIFVYNSLQDLEYFHKRNTTFPVTVLDFFFTNPNIYFFDFFGYYCVLTENGNLH